MKGKKEGKQIVTRVKVRSVDFGITQQEKDLMLYFQESEAICNIPNFVMSLDLFPPETFQLVLDILKTAEYEFPPFPPISTNQLQEVISPKLAGIFRKMSPSEINELYNAAHFLKCDGVKQCLAATLACRVYFRPVLQEFQKRKAELNITKEFNEATIKAIKERFTTLATLVGL